MQYRIFVKHNNADVPKLQEALQKVKKFFESEIDVVWTFEDKNWGYHRILEAYEGISFEIIVKNILYDLHREVNIICPELQDLNQLFGSFKNAYAKYNKPILGIVTHNPQMDDVLSEIRKLQGDLKVTQEEYQKNQTLMQGNQQEMQKIKK